MLFGRTRRSSPTVWVHLRGLRADVGIGPYEICEAAMDGTTHWSFRKINTTEWINPFPTMFSQPI